MKILINKFGKTDKIIKMQGIFLEARAYDEEASEIYKNLLNDNLLDY